MLQHLFNPKSIAVIGASRKPDKLGHIIVRNLLSSGYQGKIYPVNPEANRILNLKCYHKISDIRGTIDLAIFSIPAAFVLTALKDCLPKHLKAGIIVTAGFKETGPQGASLEKDIKSLALQHKVTLLGPNCVGLIDVGSKMNATFSVSPEIPRKGGITFFSQSGALSMGVLDWTIKEKIGLDKLISLGNKIDVDEIQLMEYLRTDKQTKVILGYLEGIEKGRKFMEVAKKVSKAKPIILVKGGTTQAGARAVSSHTGSLAGREVAYQAAFRQSGVIRVGSLPELFDIARAFINTQPLRGPNIAIVTNSGGPAILAADAIEKSPLLNLAVLNPATINLLRSKLPAGVSIYNPIDLIADADKERYRFALTTALKDSNVDAVLLIYTVAPLVTSSEIARLTIDIVHKSRKPVFVTIIGGTMVEDGINLLAEGNIPYYLSPDRAIAAFETALQHYTLSRQPIAKQVKRYTVNKSAVTKIIQKALFDGRLQLGAETSLKILSAYGIKSPEIKLARTAKEAGTIAKKMGFPVVMKVSSPDIIHKSDVKGVRLNIRDEREAREVFEEILITAQSKMPSAEIQGVSIQKMIMSGKEVIIGMASDPQFGPLLMFGLGGIYVEALKDVSFRVAPVSESDVYSMIKEIKGYPILAGVRGETQSDLEAIKETILRLAQLVMDFPQISELDINPFRVFTQGEGGIAVDARIGLRTIK